MVLLDLSRVNIETNSCERSFGGSDSVSFSAFVIMSHGLGLRRVLCGRLAASCLAVHENRTMRFGSRHIRLPRVERLDPVRVAG